MPVVVQERDAWIVRPDRRVGNVFVRMDPASGQGVVFDAITRYGAGIEWDSADRVYRERRCWDFVFDLNGKCKQAPGTYDLIQVQAVTKNGAVFIRWALAELTVARDNNTGYTLSKRYGSRLSLGTKGG
jgi:hypothetical protein